MANKQRGFNLIEMALVLVILGILLGGMITPLTTQLDASKRKQIEQTLDDIHNSLLGFSATTGRLPCPARTTSSGLADPNVSTGACAAPDGFVPARTLGLYGDVDAQGLMLDPWGGRIRYSLSFVSTYANDIELSELGTTPNIEVCNNAACGVRIADNIVAIIYATGSDLSSSADQLENLDGDTRYVKRNFSEASTTAFDDHLRWISPNILAYHLVLAGQLD